MSPVVQSQIRHEVVDELESSHPRVRLSRQELMREIVGVPLSMLPIANEGVDSHLGDVAGVPIDRAPHVGLVAVESGQRCVGWV